MSYGDLNGGSGLGKLDGGTTAVGPAPRLAMSRRHDPDFGGCAGQARWISTAMTMEVRVSLVRSADGEDLSCEQRMLMADSEMAAVRGCAALVRKSR
jgi:hypothetical protein